MKKSNGLPTTSMYCEICLFTKDCTEPKKYVCPKFKTNVPFKTKK